MKNLILLALMVFISDQAFAARGSSSRMGNRFGIGAYYLTGFFNPADLNIKGGQLITSPKFQNITQGQGFGGFFDFKVVESFHVKVGYESLSMSSKQDTTTPAGRESGFQIKQDLATFAFNYYLAENSSNFAYIGAKGAYQLTNGVTQRNTNTVTEYSAPSGIGYGANVGGGFMIGENFALILEATYLINKTDTLKTASGSEMTYSGGGSTKKAILDTSGLTASVGVGLFF
ncbi:MAG: hypothetical protein IT289_13380 [Oligoflexia bacterium]|nr:hypothetical protein [Oligoflexia bacterium]